MDKNHRIRSSPKGPARAGWIYVLGVILIAGRLRCWFGKRHQWKQHHRFHHRQTNLDPSGYPRRRLRGNGAERFHQWRRQLEPYRQWRGMFSRLRNAVAGERRERDVYTSSYHARCPSESAHAHGYIRRQDK